MRLKCKLVESPRGTRPCTIMQYARLMSVPGSWAIGASSGSQIYGPLFTSNYFRLATNCKASVNKGGSTHIGNLKQYSLVTADQRKVI